ncbi:MAG: LytTR family DNA-binding domain-containing protein [Sphingomonadaceae bacterium]|nr:LytTR family DNA-binding domain-containing protein [Sphingomonadaceae bacterium]
MKSHVPTLRGLVIEIAVMMAVGVALAIIGPFGSFAEGSFADRLAYWMPAAFGGYLIVRPFVIVAAVAADALHLPRGPALAAGVFVGALPMTFFILWLNGNAFGRLPDFDGWFQLYFQIASIGAIVTLLFWLLERRAPDPAPALAPAPATSPSPVAEPGGRFFARLPSHLGRELIAIEMEDHYLRVHTAAGNTLILLRLRDAIAELAGVDGLQVHRSWWVARRALEGSIADGRNVRLKLRNGIAVPVARNSVAALRDAGWL